jgi:hypothetical protein
MGRVEWSWLLNGVDGCKRDEEVYRPAERVRWMDGMWNGWWMGWMDGWWVRVERGGVEYE